MKQRARDRERNPGGSSICGSEIEGRSAASVIINITTKCDAGENSHVSPSLKEYSPRSIPSHRQYIDSIVNSGDGRTPETPNRPPIPKGFFSKIEGSARQHLNVCSERMQAFGKRASEMGPKACN
ncbi:hypothetical protein K438DRAFT_1892939 [Mycena galopus ATCC 62051]|nr:hypothetical protein K438DRAFT_1892939 [Mycena galopus ATCC 62051]